MRITKTVLRGTFSFENLPCGNQFPREKEEKGLSVGHKGFFLGHFSLPWAVLKLNIGKISRVLNSPVSPNGYVFANLYL